MVDDASPASVTGSAAIRFINVLLEITKESSSLEYTIYTLTPNTFNCVEHAQYLFLDKEGAEGIVCLLKNMILVGYERYVCAQSWCRVLCSCVDLFPLHTIGV